MQMGRIYAPINSYSQQQLPELRGNHVLVLVVEHEGVHIIPYNVFSNV